MSQKIKKKSTFIDMTAMSDVTVLLLTFFMLTSTFIQKEPVQGEPAAVGFRDQDSRIKYRLYFSRANGKGVHGTG